MLIRRFQHVTDTVVKCRTAEDEAVDHMHDMLDMLYDKVKDANFDGVCWRVWRRTV